MKNTTSLFLLLVILGTAASCSNNSEKAPEYPMFWTWLDYRPGMNFDSICRVISETGLDGVMLNAPSPEDYRKAIPIGLALTGKERVLPIQRPTWTITSSCVRL